MEAELSYESHQEVVFSVNLSTPTLLQTRMHWNPKLFTIVTSAVTQYVKEQGQKMMQLVNTVATDLNKEVGTSVIQKVVTISNLSIPEQTKF